MKSCTEGVGVGLSLIVVSIDRIPSLVTKRDLLALYFSGTYCHKTGSIPPGCVTPRQPTKYSKGAKEHDREAGVLKLT